MLLRLVKRLILPAWTFVALAVVVLLAAAAAFEPVSFAQSQSQAAQPARSVKGRVQTRPGGPLEETEIPVHQVPVDPPTVAADQAALREDELVLGVVLGDQAVAYPVRYLALYEVVDHRLGDTPLAPTW